MKKTIIFNALVIGFALVLLSACQSNTASSQSTTLQPQSPISVIAVETFLADITQNVAGDRVKVESLIPIGLDPHAFEPTPMDIMKIADSDVLIVNGGGFEEWLGETIENAGGERQIIDASEGLTSRTAREGEVAEMSDDELSEEMCTQVNTQPAQAVTAGGNASRPAKLPTEDGMFSIKLTPQADNTYAGYILYATDEAGDFQVVTSAGELTIQTVAEGSEVEIEKILAVECEPAAQGHIVELEKDEQYILGLTGFSSDEALLLIGPAAGHHHHEGDPHFWLDPRLVVKYVENIRDGLVAADPAGKDVYTKNAADYIVRLNELDDWIKTQVEQIPVENRLFVTNHESFGYFADRYGFQIIGTVIPSTSPETAPSAQHLSRLINRIKETGAKAIFLETGASPQLADQVAAETGVKVVTELYTHSITDQNGKAPSYIEMMKINVQEIVDALK